MPIPKFEVVTDDDENETIFLDGKEIISTSHDAHGWEGMQLARTVVERVAKALGGSYDRR